MKIQTRTEIRRLKEGNRDCGGDSHTGFAMRSAAPSVSGKIRHGDRNGTRERRVGEDKDKETKTGIRLRAGACVRAVITAAAA